jgi:hypothetical protein
MEWIAFDSHKKYKLARIESQDGRLSREARIDHAPGVVRRFLERCIPPIIIARILGLIGAEIDPPAPAPPGRGRPRGPADGTAGAGTG